ncbi:MAG: helix-turn-helix domain-containing protein, partial [Synergistaceae bacterium]
MEESVRVIERVFDLLELLAQMQEPVTLTDIVKQSGMSKTTVFRLLQTMCMRGYAEKNKDGYYSIGPKLIETASCHINGLELQTESKSVLAELRRKLNLSVHLG